MKRKLSVMALVVIIVVISANYDKLYAAFFNRFTKEIQNQACVLDFEVMGDFSSHQFTDTGKDINLNENNEAFIPIDFDVKNIGDCEIYIRVAIALVILEKSSSNQLNSEEDSTNNLTQVSKLEKSSCEFQYFNGKADDEANILDENYWEKSSDGYYYYKTALKKGESLDNRLISRVKLNLKDKEAIGFSNKQVRIAVVIEGRQNDF